MSLRAISTTTAILNGWTDPYEYGAFTADDGTEMPGGRSMKVDLHTEGHDFTICKVDAAAIDSVAAFLATAKRNDVVEVEFERVSRAIKIHKLSAVKPAARAAS